MIMVMGLVEMFSVASMLPFLAVLADPGVIETNGHAGGGLRRRSASPTTSGFLIFLGIAVFVLVVFGLLFSTLTQYAIYRFTSMRGYSISSRLLRGYLHQPYTWFLQPPQRRARHHGADRGQPGDHPGHGAGDAACWPRRRSRSS